jgi:(heptosyl)LPS beta-1,4-glucosyltransferase
MKMVKISVVVNTRNEEKKIKRCLESVDWADELVVVDMHSQDKTVTIAENFGAKIFTHRFLKYVEPARNFALLKATGDWLLVLDPDEEVPSSLAKKLQKLARNPEGNDFFRLPRKNIIFGKWVKHSRWWPDYLIRFFKKGNVTWSREIHGIPITRGKGADLEAKEENAIIHHHYDSISQFLKRLNRYTDVQAKELVEEGHQFAWSELLMKPSGEFLSRFFASKGYKDGLHGLALALLQALSELIVYLKVWEKQGFKDQELPLNDFISQLKKLNKETTYWLSDILLKEVKDPIKRLSLKLKRKISS